MSPSVRQSLAKQKVDYHDVLGTGRKGRILKTDIDAHVKQHFVTKNTTAEIHHRSKNTPPLAEFSPQRSEKRVPMSRLRQRIAERLVQAQQDAAILTTFNEVDLGEIKRMRHAYQARFQDKHGIKLGFMSFFAKAATEALKRFPEVNASIEGHEIVYHGYYDIGVAVSTERGLVVPVIKNIDQLSYAQIEQKIIDYATRARNNHLDIEELTGGTFSISNGGVFGSMLSTPILNPPQSAILGMHKIEERPVAIKGEVLIRPMMYLALSYDHRLIDGKTAVSFLIKIKELLEDPASLLLEL
jgi:2-oxoglutarate dehydrogenase E2 component (dihydrolipoamide succinyltransferase)